MTPEEHRKVCQEHEIIKSWSMKGRIMGNPPNQFRVVVYTSLYRCGHRVTRSEHVPA